MITVKTVDTMDVSYTLELFPTEGNWDKYVEYFGGTDIERDNENAGVDLYCVKTQAVTNHTATLLDLGVKARMIREGPSIKTEHCHFWLAPRSSIWKSGVRQANSLGVIDRSYRGVLMGAVLANTANSMTDPIVIQSGNRLFQVLAPDMGYISRVLLRPLEELDETSRGEGGFGSTGK
jgi:dUTP pyrophosphatase